MSEHRARGLVAALVVAALLAACSGDDDDDSGSDSTPTSATVASTEALAPSGTDAGGGTSDTAAPATGEPGFTFGFIGPGAGLLNELSIGQDRGLARAVEDINAAGGVLGAPVASIRIDESAETPVDGVVDQLLAEGANVLVGPVGSSTTAALIPTLPERSLMTCSASATATTLTDSTSIANFARTALRDDYYASIVADELMVPADGSAPPATVVVIGRDDVYGNELTAALSADLTARGAAVHTIAYPARRVTFGAEAAEVASIAPDVVVVAGYTEAPNLVNQLVAAGQPVDRIVGLDGMLVPRVAEQTFPDDPTRADGLTVIGTTGDRAFMSRLAAVPASQEQTSYGAQMYDCAISLALGAIASGSTEPTIIGQQLQAVTDGGRVCSTFAHCVALLAAGEDIDYDGPTGHIGFDAAGDISTARITTSVVFDGVLQPTAYQDFDLVDLQNQELFASAVFVAQLQQALKVLGYYDGDVTGVYDEATTAAVAALERDLGLPDTGVFDEATDAALREQLGVRVGAFGTSVAQLQQALADRGYYSGPIDGRYTAATIEAIKAFQRDLGVPETGVVDVATLQAIYASGQQTGAASVPTVPPVTYPPPTTAPPETTPETTAKPPPTTAKPPPTTAKPPPAPTTTEAVGPNLYQVLVEDGRFSMYVQVLDVAGYGPDLSQPVPITVFAPTDDAFATFPEGSFEEITSSPQAADAFLRDLAVEGELAASDLVPGSTLTSIGGGPIAIGAGAPITVDGAPIVAPDITASNGIAQGLGEVPQDD